jgi:hypothetical protein
MWRAFEEAGDQLLAPAQRRSERITHDSRAAALRHEPVEYGWGDDADAGGNEADQLVVGSGWQQHASGAGVVRR